MAFVENFLIPLIEIVIIGGIICWVGFYAFRGIYRNWKQQTKWFWKFKIMKKSYPEYMMKWCFDAIDKGIGYYDAKKILFIKNGRDMDTVYETLYIYDQFIKELHSNKNKSQEEIQNGKKFERSYSEIKTAELPLLKK